MELRCSFLCLQDSASESEECSAQLNIITLIFPLILTLISLICLIFSSKGTAFVGLLMQATYSLLYMLMVTILTPNEAHGLSCHFLCISKN
jgi:hypothetical protein